jgi:hypothetical protein
MACPSRRSGRRRRPSAGVVGEALVSRSAQDLVAIGEKLQAVKGLLKHGEWLPWLKREFSWSQRTAYNFIAVADRFKLANFASLTIEPSALYVLAAPSTPAPVVEQALTRARQGEVITQAKARALVEG